MHIRKLSEVLTASGLGVFLVTGLTGCDRNICDGDKNHLTQREQLAQKECKEDTVIISNASSSAHSTGFFMPIHSSSSSYHSSGG